MIQRYWKWPHIFFLLFHILFLSGRRTEGHNWAALCPCHVFENLEVRGWGSDRSRWTRPTWFRPEQHWAREAEAEPRARPLGVARAGLRARPLGVAWGERPLGGARAGAGLYPGGGALLAKAKSPSKPQQGEGAQNLVPSHFLEHLVWFPHW